MSDRILPIIMCIILLAELGGAVYLLWLGITGTPDVAWQRYYKSMLARGFRPERTEGWDGLARRSRILQIIAGLMLIGLIPVMLWSIATMFF